MIEENDWRLTDQKKYLYGVHLTWEAYQLGYPGYDHAHCEFCWQKFAAFDAPGAQSEGYATQDHLYWVCRECWDDFKEMFVWDVD